MELPSLIMYVANVVNSSSALISVVHCTIWPYPRAYGVDSAFRVIALGTACFKDS